MATIPLVYIGKFLLSFFSLQREVFIPSLLLSHTKWYPILPWIKACCNGYSSTKHMPNYHYIIPIPLINGITKHKFFLFIFIFIIFLIHLDIFFLYILIIKYKVYLRDFWLSWVKDLLVVINFILLKIDTFCHKAQLF